MTMPLYKGLRWIATEYINPQTSGLIGTENVQPYEYWESRVLSIDESAEIGGFMFPAGQVMQVIQSEWRWSMKRYVQNLCACIGLVARTDTIPIASVSISVILILALEWVDRSCKQRIYLSQVMIDHNWVRSRSGERNSSFLARHSNRMVRQVSCASWSKTGWVHIYSRKPLFFLIWMVLVPIRLAMSSKANISWFL